MNPSRYLAQSAAQAGPSQWACFFCQNARQQTRRLDVPSVFRRKLSGTTARRAAPQERPNAPSMQKMREHYSRKNRTVVYAIDACQLVALLSIGDGGGMTANRERAGTTQSAQFWAR